MIYGDRVRLRAIEREDVPTFYEWMNDPEIRQYLLLYEPMSKIKEEQWVESLQEKKNDFVNLFSKMHLKENWLSKFIQMSLQMFY